MPQATKRIYQKALPFETWDQLMNWVDTGNWVYLNDKVMHPSFLMSMPYRTVLGYFKMNRIFPAVHIGDPV